MKALVIYESFFHNTEDIARAVGEGLGAKVVSFEDCPSADLQGLDLLVIGSPTQRFGPTDEIQRYITALPANITRGLPVAVFDTHLDGNALRNWFIRRIVQAGGYAAPRLQKMLMRAGAAPVCAPEGFLVMGQEGPLKEGELDRARAWGASLVNS